MYLLHSSQNLLCQGGSGPHPSLPVEEAFLQALHAEPNDETTWLALADWLEEDRQEQRAELVRLVRKLRTLPVLEVAAERVQMEARVADLLAAGVRPVVPEVVNSISMRLDLIPPGHFRMGSPASEAGRGKDEGPLHEVEITRPFYLGVFPVTQAQWHDAERRPRNGEETAWRRVGGAVAFTGLLLASALYTSIRLPAHRLIVGRPLRHLGLQFEKEEGSHLWN
jgi:uncharacterized protein (TIGR02996 family)